MAAAQDGDRFWRLPEAYIRGNTIKYVRVPDEVSNMRLSLSLGSRSADGQRSLS